MTLNKKFLSISIIAIILGVIIAPYLKPDIASANVLSTLAGRNLTVGDSGSDVVDLQAMLSEQGYLEVPVGVPFGYFGPLTQSALGRYQASLGVFPAAGYYGPLTRAKIIQVFTAKGWMALLARENG